MSLFDNALSLLTIEAYIVADDEKKSHTKAGAMSVMFNPTSVQLGYQADYVKRDACNKQSFLNQFVGNRPGNLSLELLFGGTVRSSEEQVQQQVEDLKNLCASVEPKSNKPLFLKISWGDMSWGGRKYFIGHMTSLSATYTKFDRKGNPLRASVSLQLAANEHIEFEAPNPLSLPQNAVVTMPDMGTLSMLGAAAAMIVGAGAMSAVDMAITNDLDTLAPPTAGDNLLVNKGD